MIDTASLLPGLAQPRLPTAQNSRAAGDFADTFAQATDTPVDGSVAAQRIALAVSPPSTSLKIATIDIAPRQDAAATGNGLPIAGFGDDPATAGQVTPPSLTPPSLSPAQSLVTTPLDVLSPSALTGPAIKPAPSDSGVEPVAPKPAVVRSARQPIVVGARRAARAEDASATNEVGATNKTGATNKAGATNDAGADAADADRPDDVPTAPLPAMPVDLPGLDMAVASQPAPLPSPAPLPAAADTPGMNDATPTTGSRSARPSPIGTVAPTLASPVESERARAVASTTLPADATPAPPSPAAAAADPRAARAAPQGARAARPVAGSTALIATPTQMSAISPSRNLPPNFTAAPGFAAVMVPPSVAASLAPAPIAGGIASPGSTPSDVAAVPATAEPVIATPRWVSTEATAPVALAATLPDSIQPQPGTVASASQIFGAAIQAATKARDDRDAVDPTAPPPTAAASGLAPTVKAADLQQAPLDLRQDRWPHAMIERIEMLRDAADATDTRIRLVPDALGAIDVSIRKDGDTVHVHFSAEQSATRTVLQDAQPRLVELAEARGLKLGQGSLGQGALGDGGAGNGQPRASTAPRTLARADSATMTIAESPEDTRIA